MLREHDPFIEQDSILEAQPPQPQNGRKPTPAEQARLSAFHGDQSMRRGQFDEAVGFYKRAAELDGNDGRWQVSLGDAYVSTGYYRRAYKAYQRAIKRNPQDADAHFSLGELLARTGAFEEGIPEISEAIRLLPGRHYYLYRLAGICWAAGMRQEAIQALRSAVRLNPQDAFYRYKLARLLAEEGHHREANAQFQHAASCAPQDSYYRLWLAISFVQLRRIEDALEAVHEALRIEEWREPTLLVLAALLHRLLGRHETAQAYMRRAPRLTEYDRHFLRFVTQAAGPLAALATEGL